MEYLAEFVGTAILLLFGNGVVAGLLLRHSKSENSGWIVNCFGWGLGVMTAAYMVGRISGAQLNPALTLGLASIGEFSWSKVPGYIGCQLAGAFVGACIAYVHYLPHFEHTRDPETKLSVFATTPAIRNTATNLASEFIATFVLVFAIIAIAATGDSLPGHVALPAYFSTAVSPLVVGLLIVAIGLSLGGPTGYAINPARDFGPRLAHFVLPIPGKGSSQWHYAWIPIIAPVLGGVAGALVWQALDFPQ